MPQSDSGFSFSPWPFNSPGIHPFKPLSTPSVNLVTEILRLDEIHPIVSGNKIFKLWYFLRDALSKSHKTIVTFGGAWSNHLAATAFCCQAAGIRLIGIVRGEKPEFLSPTLEFCLEQGMQPFFTSRENYRALCEAREDFLEKEFGPHTLVPEGGFSETGAQGAALIKAFISGEYDYIVTAVGTATTLGGLQRACSGSRLIAIPVLKNLNDIPARLNSLGVKADALPAIFNEYHFGGYAKKTPELIDFMNKFYEQNLIPLDFVYTGKMMYGVNQLIKDNFFPENSRILAIHTGGLQGNASIQHELIY